MSMLLWRKRVVIFLCAWVTVVAHAAPWHKPPGMPTIGYGSPQAYLTTAINERIEGDGAQGTLAWVYEPAVLKNGASAPVVVVLHGFAALKPYAYRTHITHLAQQGYIVIYPQFQISQGDGVLAESGLKGEVDQSVWAERAVNAVNRCLERLGERADTSQLYIYGHSLGGLIATAWESKGGLRPLHYVLVHPALDAAAGMPAFVRKLVNIKPIDWQAAAQHISAPVTILHGEGDNIAPIAQSEALVSELQARSAPVSLYKALRDAYGLPVLSPNHGGPLDRIAPLPTHAKFFGISFELDALDWRYYFAGLDAVMAGEVAPLRFDMGLWSNGRGVKTPVLLYFSPGI